MGYHYITERISSDILDAIARFEVLGVDTETTGLCPHRDKLRLLQITTGDITYLFDFFLLPPEEKAKLREVFKGHRIAGFNFVFDVKFLLKSGVDIFLASSIFDGMLTALILENGKRIVSEKVEGYKTKPYGLAAVVKRYLGRDISKEQQVSDWSQPQLTQEQLSYGADDAEILLPLRSVMIERLAEQSLVDTALLDFNAILPTAIMEFNGMKLDVEHLHSLIPQYEKLLQDSEVQLRQILPRSYVQYDFEGNPHYNIKLSSPTQLLVLLQGMGVKDPIEEGKVLQSCGQDKLKLLDLEKYPVVDAVLDHRKADKLINTYIAPLPGYINPVTGRIHPSFGISTTATGRYNCSNPNLQNQPRDKEFRDAFIADEGCVLVSADLSQIEVRIMAELSQDPNLIEMYKKGQDVYVMTACFINEISEEEFASYPKEKQKDIRQKGKVYVLGLIYVLGAQGLQRYAKKGYGVVMSLAQAKAARSRFFLLFKRIAEYHQSASNNATRRGYAVSLDGRKKYGEISYPQAVNFPDQATGAAVIKTALYTICRELYEAGYHPLGSKDVQLLVAVHDQIDLQCKEELVDYTKELVNRHLCQAGEKYIKSVPMVAEVGSGKRWGSAH